MKEVQTGRKDDEGSIGREVVIMWFQRPIVLYSLTKKLASFCLHPENLNQGELKGRGLICLVGKISGRHGVQVVVWLYC